MKKFIVIIRLVSHIGVMAVLACTTLEIFHIIDLATVEYVQDLFMVFLFFIGIPVALYSYNTNQRKKILKHFSKK